MAVISPAVEALMDSQRPMELKILIAVNLKAAIQAARELEALHAMKDTPKVDVEQVIAGFPEHLRVHIRRSIRNL